MRANKKSAPGKTTIQGAIATARILYPRFVEQDGCVFVDVRPESDFSGEDRRPVTMTRSTWEEFCNHTHILDEFRYSEGTIIKTVVNVKDIETPGALLEVDYSYQESHRDFIGACELGRLAAQLWASKLAHDFPQMRFRVYYTEYDNPIVRFHRVRENEPPYLSDDDLRNATAPDLRNAFAIDTADLLHPVSAPRTLIH